MVCWHTEANCWGAVGAAEGWSQIHFAVVAGPEEASAADVEESSLSLLPHHLHQPSVGTGDEGHVEEASLQAAVAVLQVQDPFPAEELEALFELGSGELGVGFPQTLGCWVLWYHCFLEMEVLPQVLLAALQAAAPPSACWPSSSSASGPAGVCAAAAAAGAFA